MKKQVALLAAIAANLILGTAVVSAGEVTWWTPNFNEARARELVKSFESEHADIKVKLEITTADGLAQRILTTMQSGAAPDLIDVQHGWVNGYARNALVTKLDDVIQDREDYVPGALAYGMFDNALWAIPYRIESHAVIYNKDHFREAGLDPDKPIDTWAELATAAKALTKEGRSGFAITGGGEVGNTIFRSLPFIWMNGGSIISDDQTKATVNEPKAVEAIKFYTDMYTDLKVSPASTLENDGTANRRLFIAGTVSMYQSGQFDVVAIRKENPKIDVGVMPIPHPEGAETASILGGWSLVVPAQARNPDEGKVLLQFLARAENQAILTDTFPARTSGMTAERFKNPDLDAFKAMLPHGRALPANKNWVQITQAYFDGIQRILLGDEDVQTSMDYAAEDIQALLDQ
ncbi:ABC transporter substrate-binding protein (plasmid) [Agrobacterium sp. rho-8.1]|nr:ABC transporter substrate-binding protein [Agrobacterium sp. rho-8.1]